MAKCILVCAGDFTPMDLQKDDGDIVIAVDNGLTYLTRMGVLPDYIIGDFDSLQAEGTRTLEEFRAARPDRVRQLPVEKDDTDSMAAVRWGFELGYLRFYIYGALGGARLAHTLSNIQTLNFIKQKGGQGYIMDADQMLFLIKNETRVFHLGFEGDFSLFALDPKVMVTIRGMKYEARGLPVTYDFPIGCSNHIFRDRKAFVEVLGGTALAVVRW